MKEKLPIKYKPKEKAKMLKAGFPLCYKDRHCRSCIEDYRRIKRQKEMKE